MCVPRALVRGGGFWSWEGNGPVRERREEERARLAQRQVHTLGLLENRLGQPRWPLCACRVQPWPAPPAVPLDCSGPTSSKKVCKGT